MPIYTGKFNDFKQENVKIFVEKPDDLYRNIWQFKFSLMF